MKIVIVYDSTYGNTEKIAKAIGEGAPGSTTVVRAGQADVAGLGQIDLLVVGSPTLGGRPSEPVKDFLERLPESSVKGIKVASFDTRYGSKFVKMFGFAADRIAETLKTKGGVMCAPPEPFIVLGKKGPLKDGELERAVSWGKKIAQ